MTNQSGTARKQNTLMPARKGQRPSPSISPKLSPPRRSPRKAGGRRGRHARFPGIDRRPLLNHDGAGAAGQASSPLQGDLAFQRALLSAIAQGLERPPGIGVFKDRRPLAAPRRFEPAPHASWCTSPALQCAELAGTDD